MLKRNKVEREAFQALVIKFHELEEFAKQAMQESEDSDDSED